MTTLGPALAIENRLRANWTTTPIFVENDQFSPPVDDNGAPVAFVALEFPGGVAQQWSIGNPGNNQWREDGAFMLHICVPTGTGAMTGRQMADDLATIFRGQTFFPVVCWECNPPIPSEPPNGQYYRLSFGTRYHVQYLA